MNRHNKPATCAAWLAYPALVMLLCTISACASKGNFGYSGRGGVAQHPVAVLGVSVRHDLKATISPGLIANELAARLADRKNMLPLPASEVQAVIGADAYKKMIASYARTGRFAPLEVQQLMAADLRAPRGVMLRLENDKTEKLPVVRQAVYNEAGIRVVDRERRVYVTRRTTEMSASVIDLRTGRVVWTRLYRIKPESTSYSKQYLGSSFSGSVAAEVANTVINGFGGANYPAPPSLNGNLRALVQEVVLKLPN
ncbi:MAG: hypothetical protein AB8B63_17665 [Granulosicoccus sp.]